MFVACDWLAGLRGRIGMLVGLLFVLASASVIAEEHPLSKDQREQMARQWKEQVETLTQKLKADGPSVEALSRRADAYFFLGEFTPALADYEQMVEVDRSQDTSHWRRGIARFYAGKFKEAAHQFEIYNTFDDVDRENGIWRYFSQFKGHGEKAAQAGLLKYRKDDREPFPSVYKLFSGELDGDAILKTIRDADLSPGEREKRLFYAELYVGLNDALEGRNESARRHLRASTANTWGPKAGYGPNYMWHVGRLHYELLEAEKKDAGKK